MEGRDTAALDKLLVDIHPAVVASPRRIGDADLALGPDGLADAVAACRLHAFFRRHYPLCWSAIGGARLFAAAASLPENGLGPYLRNVQRVIRGMSDVFGLAHVAAGDGPIIEHWLAVLAVGFDRHALVQLVDDAGDRAMMTALHELLADEERRGGGNRELVRAVRDAALDHGDLRLASRAQLDLTRGRVGDAIEWLALGEILATAGDTGLAQRAFERGVAMAPGDPALRERAAALRDGRFAPYETRHGFGSPPWRVALRRRHRRAATIG